MAKRKKGYYDPITGGWIKVGHYVNPLSGRQIKKGYHENVITGQVEKDRRDSGWGIPESKRIKPEWGLPDTDFGSRPRRGRGGGNDMPQIDLSKAPPIFQILAVLLIAWALIYATQPQLIDQIIFYTKVGIALIVVMVLIFVAYKIKNKQAVITPEGGKNLFSNITSLLSFLFTPPTGSGKGGGVTEQNKTPPLNEQEKEKLKYAIGHKCEIQGCQERYHLEVHHIIPRTDPNSSNKWSNLIVLCPTHHSIAQKGGFNKEYLRQIIAHRQIRH